jgi:hypothetical protein
MTNHRAFLEQAAKEFAERGKLIEAGWMGYRLAVMPQNAPPIQIDECRLAFMAGAAHLFSSVVSILDPGDEPTDADLRRMDMIHAELQAFENEQRNRIKPENRK